MTQTLRQLDASIGHVFVLPSKKINDEQDVTHFLVSKAYRDITIFLIQLNRAMFPRLEPVNTQQYPKITTFDSGAANVVFSEKVKRLAQLVKALQSMVDEVPLDSGPRRFGNIAFRKWCQLLEDRVSSLLRDYIPASVVSFPYAANDDALTELRSYLLGSFGSSQRLDYGTGHELSFLAFLGGIWKLGGFEPSDDGNEERGIVLGVLVPYLHLVRKLILKYSLEPAGSHGVWGLDDHSFLPYIFGSAQYGPASTSTDATPTEGSRPNAPDPEIVAKADLVQKEREKNMYFGAIGFIYDVKKGPFWEHSPTLYNISGVKAGWAKINKGMLKMYDAEVLSKFPVVQHFPFGSLFSWDRNSDAKAPVTTVHTASQPIKQTPTGPLQGSPGQRAPPGTQAPWAAAKAIGTDPSDPRSPMQAPWQGPRPHPSSGVAASLNPRKHETPGEKVKQPQGSMPPPTKAPWAK